jgi:chemotaxis protein MotB
MHRYRNWLALPVVTALAVGGCVSTGKYEKLEAAKNQEITAKNQEIAAKNQQITSLQQQVATTEKEKAALAESHKQSESQYDALVKKLAAEVQQGQLQVRRYQNMLTVEAADQIFFDSGKAELKPSGKEILNKLADALKSYTDKVIRVIGYTDNVPVAPSLQKVYPSNWELSVARATSVVRYLQNAGVPPDRLVASGRGEYAPVASNDTAEGRQKNRRIEIMLIDQSLAEEMAKPKP